MLNPRPAGSPTLTGPDGPAFDLAGFTARDLGTWDRASPGTSDDVCGLAFPRLSWH